MSKNGISRRTFGKTIGVAAATAVAGTGKAAAAPRKSGDEFHGMLIDTTRCIGCRSCETACAAAKGLPAPDLSLPQVETRRRTNSEALTVVNRYATTSGYAFLKNQCMHCDQPGCASACLTKALLKTETGHVTWNGDKCMGCRMCMVSCPFDVPKFEYNSANPKIVKCDLCYDLTTNGKNPACVDSCPAGALTFGTRRELLKTARARIAEKPGLYQDHIYGEHEAGGTGVMYLAAADFDQLGMPREVGNEPYPQLTKPFLSSVPLIFAIFPMFMLALRGRREKDQKKIKNEPTGNEETV